MRHKLSDSFKRVSLFPFVLKDCEAMRLLRNRNKHCFVFNGEIDQESQAKWYQKYTNNQSEVMFSIYSNQSASWIGAVALYDINESTHESEFGRLLIDREKSLAYGLGVDATLCACKIGFEQLNLKKIKLEVFCENIAAIKTYERAGFQVTGTCVLQDGRKMFLMELLKSSALYILNTKVE